MAGSTSSPGGRERLGRLATDLGRPVGAVEAEAERYFRELRTGFGRLTIALSIRAGRALCGLGYSRIDHDPGQVERMRELFAQHPTVVLSSHRSYLDGGALSVGFADHGLPPMAEFVGINLSFWPLGAVWRRMGGIFLRRGSTGPVYRFALREYLGELVERRRPLRWFIEGTRSRTGKLAPPKLGLLAYVVDAYLEGRVDDLMLVPVSVSYDQLHEVKEFAGEARGAARQAESLGWLLRYIRAQRGRFGTIYIRFGEPVSVRACLGPPAARRPDAASHEMVLNKLAFEVCFRINRATPITGSALVAVVLLSARGQPLSLSAIRVALEGYLAYARRRGIPLTPGAGVDDLRVLQSTLGRLESQGVVARESGAEAPRYAVVEDAHLQIAYYRNSIVHFFLPGAIAELALLAAAEAPPAEREARLWREAFGLRDLLKFEFFFEDKDEFLGTYRAELARLAPDWRDRLDGGPDGVLALLGVAETLSSDMMLRAFLESYLIVADELASRRDEAIGPEAPFLARCEARGACYSKDRVIRSPEAVSRHLFATGLKLAVNRGLGERRDDLAARRAAFAAELRDVLGRMATVRQVAVRRVQALVGGQAGASGPSV